MVCDKITYGRQTLLTLYHQGFSTLEARKIKEKVGRFNLIFEENECPDDDLPIPAGWFMKEEGLVFQDSPMNPYGPEACARVEHYCYALKPLRLFRMTPSKSEYRLAIPVEDFLQIEEFVKKYTGFPITKNPMYYGDVFIYQPYLRCYHAKQAEGIVVEHLPANAMVVVRFQRNSMVVASKIVHTSEPAERVEILAGAPWDYHDIEIYADDRLIFCQKDISYVRKIHLTLNIDGGKEKVRLDKIAEAYQIDRPDSVETINIGYDPNSIEETLSWSNCAIMRKLDAERPDPSCTFICPGEMDRAVELIGKTMESALDRLWVFDSYFTDRDSLGKTMDWLRIITRCHAKEKNIVFFAKSAEKALRVDEFVEKIRADHELARFMRGREQLGLRLYQTISPIHDRFVFTGSEDTISGLALGTSFNSLDKNHYCIFRLSGHAAKTIWSGLCTWMGNGNIVSKQEV